VEEGGGCVRYSCRFVCCLLSQFNKSDLKLALLLLVLDTAMVAGQRVAGEGQQLQSEVVPVPGFEVVPLCAVHAGGRRGGGDEMEEHWSDWIWRLGFCGSFSLTKLMEQRRPLISSGSGGRWAVSLTLPVTLLVEGRPLGAAAQASALSSSSSRRDALREAVLHRCRFHSHLHWRRPEVPGWRVVDIKWFVPDGGWRVPVLWWQPGPDCDLSSRLGVLSVQSADWFVISFLLRPVLRCVLLLCIK
jgi:hypothetical protein